MENRLCLAGLPTIPFQSANQVAVADFNRDGKADVVSVIRDFVTLESTVVRRDGLGDGQFGAPSESTLAFPVTDALAGAAVGSGREMVLITPFQIPGSMIYSVHAAVVTPSQGGGNAQQLLFSNLIPSGPLPSLADRWMIDDLNADERLDLILVRNNAVQAFLRKSDGTFAQGSVPCTAFHAGTTDFASGDFNGDGSADVAGRLGSSVFISPGFSDGTFLPAREFTFAEGAIAALATGAIDGDAFDDVVVTFADGSATTAFGDAATALTRRARETDSVMANVVRVFVGDVDGNGRRDLLGVRAPLPGTSAAQLVSAFGDGAGHFSATSTIISGIKTRAYASIRSQLRELA